MGSKDERTVGVEVFQAVVIPVRRGKGRGVMTVRYEDFERAMALCGDSNALPTKIVFEKPGGEKVDLGVVRLPIKAPVPEKEKSVLRQAEGVVERALKEDKLATPDGDGGL